MRILHTSDWHLGRTFHGASLLDEQAEVVDRIVALTEEHGVELVIIAGDVFDRAVPPSPAVELFDGALARLHATGAAVVAISGNHDSGPRLGVHDRLLNQMGVAVRSQVSRLAEPLVLDHPADGGPAVAVYLVPYLEPTVDGPRLLASETAETETDRAETDRAETVRAETVEPRRSTHDRVTRSATAAIRRHLVTLPGVRSVVVAHTFVAGGAVSDSERDLSVGSVERVAVEAFAGFHLVALGHLHAPQEVDGARVAYSGTPLPYSFSEEGQAKSVRLVDLAADGSVAATVLPLGVGRPLRTVTGTLEELLSRPDLAPDEAARVRAIVTDPHLPNQAMARLRQRFPHAVELRHQPAGTSPVARRSAADLQVLEARSPLDLALTFWAEQQGAEATEAEARLLARAIEANLAEVDR